MKTIPIHDLELDLYDDVLQQLAADKKIKLGTVTPAKQEDVDAILALPTEGNDNRSDWVWLRLADGTLILGVFPQGDTYMEYAEKNQV